MLNLSTGPAVEPITLTEAKVHLRVEHTDEDEFITGLIVVARRLLERYTFRSFITQTWKLTLDEFPGFSDAIRLPNPPILSTDFSIAYQDENNAAKTLAATKYVLDISSEPGRVTPANTETWPSTYDQTGAVVVTYKAGYGAAASAVPDELKHAIKLLIGDLYKDRESPDRERVEMIPKAIQWLCEPYRVFEFR